ncbi:fibronectin type III domain-containing protein [Sphingobacterium faecale]|uniref:Fibronectin type III domain-containing protein n=1 Tax=Sphingobacterium faecale TaxID=2803775 RepID=A0ABS1R2M2_9SPHI|nr:fibronectin type III domain-containing protein [Sphingobacterium faecale]MBL1408690.1 fibronectin type III domain-containing protein [Sphingobacterium faecale]
MRKERIYISYSEWDDYSLSSLAGKTLAAMKNNVKFPDPKPDMADYELLVNDFRSKHEMAVTGGQLERKARDNARDKILSAMRQLAFYVNVVADGDGEVLASSGFMLVPPPKAKGHPTVMVGMRLEDGRMSGEVKFAFTPQKNISEYEYCYATELDEEKAPIWGETKSTSTSRTNYISGFTPGEKVYFRVRARNNKGIGDWSEPIYLIVR